MDITKYPWENPFEKITLIKDWKTRICPLHSHDFIELVYVYGGEGTHTINGKTANVSAGDLLIMAYGDSHTFNATKGMGIFNCEFQAEFLNSMLPTDASLPQLLQFPPFAVFSVDQIPMPVRLFGKAQLKVDALLHQMLDEYQEKQQGYIDVMRTQLRLLLLQIVRFLAPEPVQRKKDKLPDGLLAYLQQNCHQKLTLRDIADKCHYHPAYFSALFCQCTGMNFSAYVRCLRLDAAMRYLAQTNLPIDKIRQLVGFGNSTAFYCAFREATGASPQEYRENLNKQK